MTLDQVFTLSADCDASRREAEALFTVVARQLAAALPTSAEVLHVGATAIPGCLTKGDLDIVVRVEPADFPAGEARLAALFVRNHDSVRTDQFAAFVDTHRTPHLGIQLTAKDGPLDVFHHFVAALREDRELVGRYNALKQAFQARPMAHYRAAKDRFVAEVLASRPLALPGRSGEV